MISLIVYLLTDYETSDKWVWGFGDGALCVWAGWVLLPLIERKIRGWIQLR